MSDIKVSLSNFDRGINIFSAVNSYKSRKLNEQILAQHYKSNAQLSSLNRQIQQANSINRKILENQLKEEQKREAQKYYKSLSFFLSEITNGINGIKDEMVFAYTMEKYYAKTKLNIIESIENCDEIADKTFNKNTLTKLENLKQKCNSIDKDYQSNILYNIDNYIEDYKKTKEELLALEKPTVKFQPAKQSNTNSALRIIGIVLLAIPTLLFLILLPISMITPPETGSIWGGLLFLILLFGTPLFFLVKNERKWRAKSNERLQKQTAEFNNYNSHKESKELEFTESQERIKKEITNHPLHDAMNNIFNQHPKFDETMMQLNRLTLDFDKKWK